MKKNEKKAFGGKLLTAINKVLKDNNAEETVKIEKAVVKSVKRISRNVKLKRKIVAAAKVTAKPKKQP